MSLNSSNIIVQVPQFDLGITQNIYQEEVGS